jgi:hypothetical protein
MECSLPQKQIAEHLGVRQPRVSKMVERGMPTDSLQAAAAWYESNVRVKAKPAQRQAESAAKRAASDPYQRSRATREAAEASIAELELARRRKEVVRRDAVERAGFDAARGLRDAVMAASRRIAAEVAPLNTAGACEAVLARELRQLLEGFVADLRKRVEGAEA